MPAHRKPVVEKTAAGHTVAVEPVTQQAYVMKSSWLRDAAERITATFAQAFLGVFGATQIIAATSGHLDVSVARMALSAGIAAVLALAKSVLAKYVAGTVSPASLAPVPSPVPVDPEAGHSSAGVVLFVVILLAAMLLGGFASSWFFLLAVVALLALFL